MTTRFDVLLRIERYFDRLSAELTGTPAPARVAEAVPRDDGRRAADWLNRLVNRGATRRSRSATISVGMCVFADGTSGMTEATTTSGVSITAEARPSGSSPRGRPAARDTAAHGAQGSGIGVTSCVS
jgi:hypothetical protein